MADWRKIKTEYITGDVSLRALAEKSGVSFSQIGKRAAAEKWKEQREKQRNKTETKAKQKAAEKISDAESDIAALKAESRRLLWEVTRDRIKGITKATEAADVRRYVQKYTDLLNSEPQGIVDDQTLLGQLWFVKGLAEALENIKRQKKENQEAFAQKYGVQTDTDDGTGAAGGSHLQGLRGSGRQGLRRL